MNKTVKHILEFLAILVLTAVVALSSPFNPWIANAFTAVQEEILDIAYSVREGYLAYVELDGHYGPVVYEFFGLGYLLTDTHIVHFIMESVINFISILFLYKTAKLYTSNLFAWFAAGTIAIFSWGALTHAGAEEILFFIMSLSSYHIARQLKDGFLSHHAYLLAIDLGLVFFLQPGYILFWAAAILFFAIKFRIDGVQGKEYRSFCFSTLEGLFTVAVPMGIYLWYFKNAQAFLSQVVVYNFKNIGTFAEGIKIVCGTPWIIFIAVLVFVIIAKVFTEEKFSDLGYWLGLTIVGFIVIALQGDNLDSYLEVSKVFYIVPLAGLFSLIDKPLGLKAEDRYGQNQTISDRN